MYRKSLLSVASAVSLLAFAGCGSSDIVIGPSAVLPDTRCDEGLCASNDVVDQLVDARTALDSCVPDAEQGFESDPAGLRIANVELSEERGATFIDVLLANTGSQNVYDAPGTQLTVTGGDAQVANERGLNPNESASTQTYAVPACQTEAHRYRVELGEGTITLQVSAMWDVHRSVETLEIEIVRPREER